MHNSNTYSAKGGGAHNNVAEQFSQGGGGPHQVNANLWKMMRKMANAGYTEYTP
jgi:hypothetical protein